MVNTFKMTFVLWLAALACNAQQWQQKEDIPVAGRWGAFCFSIGSKIYLGGGYKGNFVNLSDFWEYNTETNEWTQKNDLPGADNRTAGIAFSWNSKGYIGLGSVDYNTINAEFLNDLWEYDPANDTWSQKMSLPDSGRHEASVFVVGNKAYITGGVVDYPHVGTNDVWELDLDLETWTSKTPYPRVYLSGAMGFSHGGMGYVACGLTNSDTLAGEETSKRLFMYDPGNDTWTQKADYCGNTREGGVAFVLGDSAFVGLGTGEQGVYTYFYEEFCSYDFATDTWNQSASYPEIARAYAVAAVADNKAYVGGGWLYTGTQYFYTDWYEFHSQAPSIGIEEKSNEYGLKLYPNPAYDRLNIACDKNPKGPLEYRLYNTSGQLIRSGSMRGEMVIDISGAGEGLHLLEIKQEDVLVCRDRILITSVLR